MGWPMRQILKAKLVNMAIKVLSEDVSRDFLSDIHKSEKVKIPELNGRVSPYYEYIEPCESNAKLRNDIVFITGRFRSGSTTVWNMFRQLESCKAFYEPFNERKWFLKENRGSGVDSTHRGVSDYSREYDDLEILEQFFEDEWTYRELFMDSHSWNPKMSDYILEIVKSTKLRPILQFNRVDFRLEWLKKHFPEAKILHLYRNPRDQWCSFLTDKALMNSKDVETTYADNFYLNSWCRELSPIFPFLDKRCTSHPYQRFYYLWKLSFMFGKHYADYSFSYESVATNPELEIKKIFDVLGWSDDIERCVSAFEEPALDKWKQYAADSWFYEHENICEQRLKEFFL